MSDDRTASQDERDVDEGIDCSVVVLTRNSATTLPRALASVTGFAEVIVADPALGGESASTGLSERVWSPRP